MCIQSLKCSEQLPDNEGRDYRSRCVLVSVSRLKELYSRAHPGLVPLLIVKKSRSGLILLIILREVVVKPSISTGLAKFYLDPTPAILISYLSQSKWCSNITIGCLNILMSDHMDIRQHILVLLERSGNQNINGGNAIIYLSVSQTFFEWSEKVYRARGG